MTRRLVTSASPTRSPGVTRHRLAARRSLSRHAPTTRDSRAVSCDASDSRVQALRATDSRRGDRSAVTHQRLAVIYAVAYSRCGPMKVEGGNDRVDGKVEGGNDRVEGEG